jgi:threonine aldolase
MLVAGIQATRGDDVYHDDPATTHLENRVASLTGKEAGLFLVSGTMSNREFRKPHMRIELDYQ